MGALAYISVRAYVRVRVGEWGGRKLALNIFLLALAFSISLFLSA